MPTVLSSGELARDLSLTDLTDPACGPHAMQQLVDDVTTSLTGAWSCPARVVHPGAIVSVEDCYDRLGFTPSAISRDRRYTRYVSATCMLRSHTSAAIPPELRALADAGYLADILLVCPGLVYRRDVIDRLHTGTPHQLDLWRILRGAPLGPGALDEMITLVVGALLPGAAYRTVEVSHPYTDHGLQIDVRDGESWVEVGECGVAAPAVLARAGLDTARVTGLAMGLGLDRILMLRKGVPDIRLLRSTDPRVSAQMTDLEPYRPVSYQPPVVRDLSLAVDESDTEETIGDRVRGVLGSDCTAVEEITVLSETAAAALAPSAIARLGLQPGQKNVLLRVVLRDLDRTLTSADANVLRDRIYAGLHLGTRGDWSTNTASVMMTVPAGGPKGGQT